MPTASDYIAAAQRWRQSAEGVAELAGAVSRSLPLSALGVCPVRDLLDDATGVSELNVGHVSNEFGALAEECIRRAVVCAAFDVAMTTYESQLQSWNTTPEAERGLRPTAPSPPHSWVERSS